MNKEKKEKKERVKKVKCASIGGQAVMEGVMMRGSSSMAVAVRDEEGVIRVESSRFTPIKKRNIFFRIPIIRGVLNFGSSMATGMTTLTKSAEVFGEGEPSKFEKWLSEKLHINIMSVVIAIGMILGIALAVGLFFILPNLITINLFRDTLGWEFTTIINNLIEGGVRMAIFIGYLLLVSCIKDIRRTFMYHGAEHRVISCYEHGYEMTVENAQKCSTIHNRCGTTFMFFVMLLGIITFSLFDGIMESCGVTIFRENTFYRVLAKIALLPLVAGLGYELLKLLAKSDFFLLYILKAPGMLLQCITTKKPTNAMVEVALTAFNTVLEMDANQDVPVVKFVKPQKTKVYHEQICQELSKVSNEAAAETDWIFCKVLDVKRDEIETRLNLKISEVEKIDELVAARLTGKPLQYVLGDTEFYGYTIKTDSRALIPRFDTEILADEVIKHISANSNILTALEICTGSGAVAIAIKKATNVAVTASDISTEALELARENAAINGAAIEFVTSDMFSGFDNRKFDIIIANPPYIKTEEIQTLGVEVKDYEPRMALDGGEDGLVFYRIIAENAFNYLNNGGYLFIEAGANQADSICALFGEHSVQVIKDLSGIDRVIKVGV